MILALVLSAYAGDTPEVSPEPSERESSFGNSGGGGSKKKSGSGGSDDESSKYFKVFKVGKWKVQPYVEPGGGLQIGTADEETVTSVVAGAEAGLHHWRKKWDGNLYVGASYTGGSAYNGFEVNLGEELGIRKKNWGLSWGLEAFYDAYTSENLETLEPTGGVNIPLLLTLGPKKYYGFVGLTPGFVTNPNRAIIPGKLAGTVGVCNGVVGGNCANPKNDFFIGHEFSWTVGVGVSNKYLRGQVGIVHEINASTSLWTPVLTLTWSG
jgi:hypothetical protein